MNHTPLPHIHTDDEGRTFDLSASPTYQAIGRALAAPKPTLRYLAAGDRWAVNDVYERTLHIHSLRPASDPGVNYVGVCRAVLVGYAPGDVITQHEVETIRPRRYELTAA